MPTLIMTRSRPQSIAFAQELEQMLDRPFATIVSPAFHIRPIDIALPAYDQVIFTSANGVSQAQRLGLPPGTIAWCVGDRTALAAQAAGYQPRSANGDADALKALLLQERPTGRLLHLSGQHTRGNIATDLARAGLTCQQVVVYDQTINPPTQDLLRAMAGNAPLVSPVFSPRSAAPLSLPDRTAPLHGVALSAAVAEALEGLHCDTITVARTPTKSALLEATCSAMVRLFDRR